MKILKIALGAILLVWWGLSFDVLSTSNDIKIFTYNIDSLTVTFLHLFLILSFISLSFLNSKLLSVVVAVALSFISVYLLFSFKMPFRESVEQLGLTSFSFASLLFSVVDAESNYVNHPIHELINDDAYQFESNSDDIHHQLDGYRYESMEDDLYHISSNSTYEYSLSDSIVEQGSTIDLNDTFNSSFNTQDINPTTGLISISGIDTLGNPYGCDLSSSENSFDTSHYL